MGFEFTSEDDLGVDSLAIQLEDLELKLAIIQEDVITRRECFMQIWHVEGNEYGAFTQVFRVLG